MKIGLIGLGKMGFNLALNAMENNHQIIAYDKIRDKIKNIAKEGANPAYSIKELVDNLPEKKIIWIMVTAGKPVDEIILNISPYLKKEDIIIDGGNSYFEDSIRRYNELKKKGINFFDCGTSGGISGARHGACMMIGGDKGIFKEIESLFRCMSVKEGYGYMGEAGAGHFIKMVHNGIEYGMMGAIGEGLEVIEKNKKKFNLDIKGVANVYAHGSIIEGKLVNWLLKAINDKEYFKSILGTVPQGETEKEMEKLSDMSNMPILEEAIEMRKKTRKEPRFSGKIVSALRNRFGGHKVERK
jgi:6-phosphogluconate dehydrogenase|tara:strand:+ start:1079 stop:1975 length:897 start_codon:yes stop_codon:yes gene_type:complete